MTKIAGSGSASGSISQSHGSADPDPHQNVMDPEHCTPLKWTIQTYLVRLCFLHLGERGLRQHKMRSSCGKEEEEGEVVEGEGVGGPAPTPLDESCYIID